MGAKLEFRYEGNKRIQFNSFCVEFRERMMLLKRIDLEKNAIEQKKTKPGLKFKPRIVLIRLEQLGPGLLRFWALGMVLTVKVVIVEAKACLIPEIFKLQAFLQYLAFPLPRHQRGR